jgi:hypothetical protein
LAGEKLRLPTTCHFVFVFQATRPAAAATEDGADRRPSHPQPLPSYRILLLCSPPPLSFFFSSISEKDGKKDRKKNEIKTKAKKKTEMTSKMDDF